MSKEKPGFVKTDFDDLTFKVNGLAMQTHNELKPGQAEKFYQRRLAQLCQEAGLEIEIEKRVEVWVEDSMIGYLRLDLWVEGCLVVECKAFSHLLTNDELGQVLTYLAATGSAVGMLYNFGRPKLEYKRIFPSQTIQDWRKNLYRYIHRSSGMKLPSLLEPDAKGKSDTKTKVPPIRFKTISSETTLVEIPSPQGAAIRLSAARQQSVEQSAYAQAGVDIEAGNRSVELMKSAVQATHGPEVLSDLGSFGGLFSAASLKAMDNPVLVASTDGVGTKVMLAAQSERYAGVGKDIVNHCINDILVQGAQPLFFMDYFASSKLDPEVVAEVVRGMAVACQEAGCALLGGETAEMPGVYHENHFDVAGTIVGILEKTMRLPRPNIQPGDLLVGLASSGPHTNGYSLIRQVFDGISPEYVYPELEQPLKNFLLEPHRNYFPVLNATIKAGIPKGLVHITGGGFIDNIPRILPTDCGAILRKSIWTVPPLFELIQKLGKIDADEMYRVFNMGIGMVAVIAANHLGEFQTSLAEPTWVIGEVITGDGVILE